MNTEIDRTKNMIVYDSIGGLYFEHNNHDNSCYLMGYNGFYYINIIIIILYNITSSKKLFRLRKDNIKC